MGKLGCYKALFIWRGAPQSPLLILSKHYLFSQILACVNVHPLISSAVEAAKEDLYEVLEEVNCPTMMLTCRDNCPNEKPGGFASNVYKWVNNSSPCDSFAVLCLLASFVNLRS